MPKSLWYDPKTEPSEFMAALWKVRHLCTRPEHTPMTVPGSYILLQAIMSAILVRIPELKSDIAALQGVSNWPSAP